MNTKGTCLESNLIGSLNVITLSLTITDVPARTNRCRVLCSAEAEAGVSSDRSLVGAALSLALTLWMLRSTAPPPHVVQVRQPHLALSVTRHTAHSHHSTNVHLFQSSFIYLFICYEPNSWKLFRWNVSIILGFVRDCRLRLLYNWVIKFICNV